MASRRTITPTKNQFDLCKCRYDVQQYISAYFRRQVRIQLFNARANGVRTTKTVN